MKRWSFVTGLTVIFLMLLSLGGFSILTTRNITRSVEEIITTNYDSIRAVRELRSSTTRLNATYRSATSLASIPSERALFEQESTVLTRQARFILEGTRGPEERERGELLLAYVNDYLAAYATYLDLAGRTDSRSQAEFESTSSSISRLTSLIAGAGDKIVESNEAELMARRNQAVERGRRGTYLVVGISLFALLVYLTASYALARGIYQPLTQLRNAIERMRARRFDEEIAISDVSQELGEIIRAFNQMAAELRLYVLETDEKAVRSARDCRAILTALPHPVFIVNPDYSVRLSNPKGEALATAAGVPGALPAIVRRHIDEAAARQTDLIDYDLRRVVEIPIPDPARPERTLIACYLPQVFRLINDQKKHDGWATMLKDVTAMKRLDDAKTKALSTLGHEVKTPITGIRMTLHLLLEEKIGALTADQRELIQAGRDDCERLLGILQALLELARLESGRTPFKFESVAVGALIDQALANVSSLLRSSGREVVRAAESDDGAQVRADALHAGRVLGNFLSNAMKYGVPGTPLHVRAVSRADGFARVSVVNTTARQLTEAEQLRVFDSFYRRAGENGEGAGLGLTIAREIAAAHGGRVGVWCEGDKVEFYFDLPLVPVPAIPVTATEPSASAAG